jgi:hypothetical protein
MAEPDGRVMSSSVKLTPYLTDTYLILFSTTTGCLKRFITIAKESS